LDVPGEGAVRGVFIMGVAMVQYKSRAAQENWSNS